MSLLFADIYDGIRTIRITKGVSEKDILNFVQDKVGGCMKVSNVLKTIRTLKKLCEDGVLMKKGKRYMFAPKGCRKDEDDDDDEGEEDDECQEEIQPAVADSCDECGDEEDKPEEQDDQQEEEEDDDDDDDEEEDDDDDDDDEDECDEKDVQANCEEGTGNKSNEMESRSPIKSKESFLGGSNGKSPPSGDNGDNGNGTPSCLDKKVNRAMTGDSVKKPCNDKARKGCKGKSMVDQDDGDATKGNEAIAFCVRDFIDSLGQPDSEGKDGKEKTQNSEAMLEENMDLTKPLEFSRDISLRKRAFRNKRNAGRSRSPVKEVQGEMYHCLGKGPSDEIGFRSICSDFFQEPTDADMELEQRKEEEITTLHRNLPTNSGEPCGGDGVKKLDSVIIEGSYDDFRETLAKKTSLMSQVQNNECSMAQMTWYPLEEREKESETANRSSSCEDERTGGDKEKTASLCSVCEKKKRNL